MMLLGAICGSVGLLQLGAVFMLCDVINDACSRPKNKEAAVAMIEKKGHARASVATTTPTPILSPQSNILKRKPSGRTLKNVIRRLESSSPQSTASGGLQVERDSDFFIGLSSKYTDNTNWASFVLLFGMETGGHIG